MTLILQQFFNRWASYASLTLFLFLLESFSGSFWIVIDICSLCPGQCLWCHYIGRNSCIPWSRCPWSDEHEDLCWHRFDTFLFSYHPLQWCAMSCVSYFNNLQIQQSAMLSLLIIWKHFLPLPSVPLCVAFV